MNSMLKSVMVDGLKLRGLLNASGMRQQQLAEKVGTTKAQVSRWMARGERHVMKSTLAEIGKVFGLSLEEMQAKCAPDASVQQCALRDDEQDWLNVWRKLKPLQRYGLRLHVEEYVQKMLSNETHGTRSGKD